MGHNFLEGGRKFDCCNEIILLEIFFTSTTSPSQYVSPYHSHRQVSLSWDRLANEEILAPIYSVFHLLQTACYLSMLLLFYYQKKKGEIPRQQCQAARLSDMCFSLYSYIYIIRLYLCWLPSRLCPDTQQQTYEQETQKPSTRKGGQNYHHSPCPLFQLLESQRICRKLNHSPLHC